MTLKAYLQILRKRWPIMVACTLLGVIVASAFTLLAPRVYVAQTTSFVSIVAGGTQSDSLYNNSQFALKQVTSYAEVVHGPDVLQPVIDELHLGMTVQELDQTITATNPVDTVLLTVSAQSSSPTQAQTIANSVSKHLGTAVEALETPRAGGSSPVKVAIAVPASVPSTPASPRPPLNIALGLLVGLALGIGAAVLREHLDTTVKSLSELADLTGLTPLGAIVLDPDLSLHPLLSPQSSFLGIEAFRSIRTNLQFVDVDRPPRQVVITSAIANEGKTTTACNLAITMAQAHMKVCLVEGDLRRPMAMDYLGIMGGIGLSNVAAGQFSLDDVLVPWNRGQLFVLPAGTTPSDPSQLLGSQAVADVLAELRSRFDMVIIDAPPLLPVSDAAVLSRASDGAVIVARHSHVRHEQITQALADLDNVNARLIGAVLTFVPAKERVARYGHGYASKERRADLAGQRETSGPPSPARQANDTVLEDAHTA